MQGGLTVQSLEITRSSPAHALLLPGVSTAAEAARATLQMKERHLRTFRNVHRQQPAGCQVQWMGRGRMRCWKGQLRAPDADGEGCWQCHTVHQPYFLVSMETDAHFRRHDGPLGALACTSMLGSPDSAANPLAHDIWRPAAALLIPGRDALDSRERAALANCMRSRGAAQQIFVPGSWLMETSLSKATIYDFPRRWRFAMVRRPLVAHDQPLGGNPCQRGPAPGGARRE